MFSFDPIDAINLNINYLPLFCSSSFTNIESQKIFQFDIYFVGNVVTCKRYKELQDFKRFCKREKIKFAYYFHCSPVMFFKLFCHGFLPYDISLSSIDSNKFKRILQQSKAVFDFANHKQCGYTMRIFENLCNEKKIITNNQRIQSESFFSPDRILVIKDSNYSQVKAFLEIELEKPDFTFSEFHLNSWIRNLIEK